MARLLLTGAGGFVGGALMRHLIDGGHDVVTLGRGEKPIDPRAEHLTLDLLTANEAGLKEIISQFRATHLIHAAWYTNHRDYLVHEVNRDWLEASTRLASAFYGVQSEGRFVGLGTCVEYAQSGGRCTEGETALEPWTLYGECKVALSERLAAFPNSAWARLFFIYGPGDRDGRLIPHLIDCAVKGEPVSVRFGGLLRDYIHVDDLAAQLAAITLSEMTGAINTGTGSALPLADFATITAAASGHPELAEVNEAIAEDQPLLIEADMTRFRDTVGSVNCRSFADGIAPLIAERAAS